MQGQQLRTGARGYAGILDGEAILRLVSQAHHRVVNGEGMILLEGSGQAPVVSQVGSRLLELLDGSLSLEEILPRLEGEYDVEPEVLRSDVLAFLRELVRAGVVERVE